MFIDNYLLAMHACFFLVLVAYCAPYSNKVVPRIATATPPRNIAVDSGERRLSSSPPKPNRQPPNDGHNHVGPARNRCDAAMIQPPRTEPDLALRLVC